MTAIEFLRRERSSYVIGSLIALAVSVAAVSALWLVMEPQFRQAHSPDQLLDMIHQAQESFTTGQAIALEIVNAAAAIGLFMLNWRFSVILRRPRGAFASLRPFSGPRLAWVLALVANSMFYGLLLPQLALTYVLNRWGREEIARAEALAAATMPRPNGPPETTS